MAEDIVERVRVAGRKQFLYLPHAIRQMSRFDRMITAQEVQTVAMTGRLVEDYPEDPRGHSCLLLGYGEEDRAIHIVAAPKDDYLAIITAYVPDPSQWSPDFLRRA
ncbi:MAG: DUF4258 domain-containing protein [Nitrospiraceae bacterium]|jgi:CelD/BcsL family acetyltransferase involved in cellulose biosynthesis|uniref:DUF4258 domain-containing protein n=1 Tax=Nitrospira cf. moscoviensis SBR1015 TaxID=96242 RepID=UPI000A0D06A6|nr:DUF4258 domain-containing protein [Nitrospira cf. moscoviensis SBR1015]MBY0248413.1 DUF4258 domain-containing protein [Nitrospiraceae bacterium]OQW33232.1 MAG: hypothetical protein A4E20_13020 [Nitrospira sp. SG-bin2]